MLRPRLLSLYTLATCLALGACASESQAPTPAEATPAAAEPETPTTTVAELAAAAPDAPVMVAPAVPGVAAPDGPGLAAPELAAPEMAAPAMAAPELAGAAEPDAPAITEAQAEAFRQAMLHPPPPPEPNLAPSAAPPPGDRKPAAGATPGAEMPTVQAPGPMKGVPLAPTVDPSVPGLEVPLAGSGPHLGQPLASRLTGATRVRVAKKIMGPEGSPVAISAEVVSADTVARLTALIDPSQTLTGASPRCPAAWTVTLFAANGAELGTAGACAMAIGDRPSAFSPGYFEDGLDKSRYGINVNDGAAFADAIEASLKR